ncbi:hypothetical protein ABMA70_15905, partial [Halobacteriovorax sp. XZX-3]|uniref:hypothetical protein n=1 Tax=Halobacteriovorax sp. XZX-3 TaxID=3157722 RepID=UPI00371A0F7E
MSRVGFTVHTALEAELASKAVPPAPTPTVSAWEIKDPDEMQLETPDGNQVFVCGSGWRIMYGADAGAADDLVYYVNTGDYQRAIDVLRKYKDSAVTGWGYSLLTDLENYMAKHDTHMLADPLESDT